MNERSKGKDWICPISMCGPDLVVCFTNNCLKGNCTLREAGGKMFADKPEGWIENRVFEMTVNGY